MKIIKIPALLTYDPEQYINTICNNTTIDKINGCVSNYKTLVEHGIYSANKSGFYITFFDKYNMSYKFKQLGICVCENTFNFIKMLVVVPCALLILLCYVLPVKIIYQGIKYSIRNKKVRKDARSIAASLLYQLIIHDNNKYKGTQNKENNK